MENKFCSGSGIIMNMNGFISFYSSSSNSFPCFNLLFKSYTLDNKLKYSFSYSSVQFRGLRSNKSISRGWIEKEIYLMTSCLSSDIDVLEKICRDLHLKLRQTESYSLELQSRLEESLREVYSSRGRNCEEFIKQQCSKLSEDLRQSKSEVIIIIIIIY